MQCAAMHMDTYLMLWGKSLAHRFSLHGEWRTEVFLVSESAGSDVIFYPFVKPYLKLWPEKWNFAFSLCLKDCERDLTLRHAQLCACFAVLQVSRGIHPASGWSSQQCPTSQRGRRDF